MTRQPNVLLLMCDQLNAGVLGCYGGPVPTPNLDRIAQEGVLFTDAVCPTPFCSPSRASIVTGLYPHAHGIVSNVNRRDYPAIPAPPTEEGIKLDDLTTDRLLHEAGYETHHYGKWHLLDDDLPYYPDTFTEHDAYAKALAATFAEVRRRPRETWMEWYGWALPTRCAPAFQAAVAALGDRWDDRKHAEFIVKMGRLELPVEQNFDVMVADRTCETLSRVRERPFSITCSFNYPHDPNVVPSPYYELFDPAAIELPANTSGREERFEGDWSREIVADLGEAVTLEFLRIYYASTKLIDDQVGRVLDALDATGRADDTIVVFLSDHGDMAGGHGMIWKSTHSFYDEVARVPLLIRYPKAIPPARLEVAANLVDLMPTLLDLTGQPIPDGVQGRSLAPWLTGDADPATWPSYTFSERIAGHPEGRRQVRPGTRGSFMARGQGWKYARFRDGAELLYDLNADPGELIDLATSLEHRDRLEEMRGALDQWLTETGFPG